MYFLGSLVKQMGIGMFPLIHGQEKGLVTYADTSAMRASTLILDSVILSSELPLLNSFNCAFCPLDFIFSWRDRCMSESGTLSTLPVVL